MLRIFSFFFKEPKVLLGRWGYHWEINKMVKKYYD